MQHHTHLLHEALLNNNCPECYSNGGLVFTFTQEERENLCYRKAAKEVQEKLFCHDCNTHIYPVNWDEDIERVYNYNRKLAVPKNNSIKLKPIAYWVVLLAILLVGAIIYYYTT